MAALQARFRSLFRALCGTLVVQGVLLDEASAIGPSDCKLGHADSTCATGVIAGPAPSPTPAPAPPPAPQPPTRIGPGERYLYSSPIAIAGLPGGGIAYWGYDFLSHAQGVPSPMGQDVYVNRSAYALKLRFTFTTPPNRPCGDGCLPRLEFRMGPAWALRYTPFTVAGGTAVAEYEIPPNYFYAFVIGLQDTVNPTLQVITNENVSLAEAGLPERLDVANPVPTEWYGCMCNDGQYATCNYGTRYSSGLMGHWDNNGFYYADDHSNTCPAKEGS